MLCYLRLCRFRQGICGRHGRPGSRADRRGQLQRRVRSDVHATFAVYQVYRPKIHLQRDVGTRPDTLQGRSLVPVRAAHSGPESPARGPEQVFGDGRGVRPDEIRRTAVRGPVARRAPGLRPVSSAPLLRAAGRDRALPGHDERGQSAPVERCRAVRESE